MPISIVLFYISAPRENPFFPLHAIFFFICLPISFCNHFSHPIENVSYSLARAGNNNSIGLPSLPPFREIIETHGILHGVGDKKNNWSGSKQIARKWLYYVVYIRGGEYNLWGIALNILKIKQRFNYNRSHRLTREIEMERFPRENPASSISEHGGEYLIRHYIN